MKKILLAILFCSSIECFAQKKAVSVYNRVFAEFVKAYNNSDSLGIAKLFDSKLPSSWTSAGLRKDHEEWGKITGFKYIGPFNNKTDVDGRVAVYYKVTFDRKAKLSTNFPSDSAFNGRDVHAAAIALNDKNLISGCAIWTSSEKVDSLIARY